MKSTLTLALALIMPVAAMAQAQMTKDQLFAWATEVRACHDLAIEDVAYVDAVSNGVQVRCGDATGVVPLAGFAAIGSAGIATAVVGIGLAAAAGGGGGSTPDTQ